MTLNDFECQNRGLYGFFGDFWLRDTLQERIAPKPIKIDMDKLRMKFSALNVDFNGLSLDFLCSRNPVHEGIKEQYPRKNCDEMAGDRLTVCEQELL